MPTPFFLIRVLASVLAAAIAVACRPDSLLAVGPAGDMIELTLKGHRVEGVPLRWSRQQVVLLGRDGRLWKFAPEEASGFRNTSSQFRSYPPSEFRAVLLRELGDGYEVSGTTHYLVAHPEGQHDKWAQRLEDLYRWFVHYFAIRGFELATPPYPLVGVVCRNRDEFARRAATQDSLVPGAVVGYYSPSSNRINLYDTGGKNGAVNWQRNAGVLIHEATHQMAFNTGVHSRYSAPPKWLVEGLATLFEAPGVYDPRGNPRPADRVNQDRLRAFQRGVAPHHRPQMLASLVDSDDLFNVSPPAAYAEAWALTFFLVETQPRKYVDYLKRTAARPPFRAYTAAERTADFAAVFGTDWRMLEAHFLRFMSGVK
jgi:hypothetical protein